MPLSDSLSRARHIIECYQIYRVGDCSGQAYMLTNHDTQVTLSVEGNDYVFDPAHLGRSAITRQSDETHDTVTLTANAVEPFLSHASRQGVDGATLKIYGITTKELKSTYEPEDYQVLFWGNVSNVSRSDVTIAMEFSAWNRILTNQVPTHYFQRSCNFELYDNATCRANKITHTFDATVAAITETRYALEVTVEGTHIGRPFVGGIITFGDCLPRTINFEEVDGGNRKLYLIGQVPPAVVISDAVTVSYGCDRTMKMCNETFNNAENFGGFPGIRIKNPATDTL